MNVKITEVQIKVLLEKYIMGECTEEETVLLESWYEEMVGRGKVVKLFNSAEEERLVRGLWKAIGEQEAALQQEQELAGAAKDGQTITGNRRPGRRLFRIAAIWAGIVVVTGGAGIQFGRWMARSSAGRRVDFTAISTGYQQVRKVLLPDSSVVWLNSATRLAYHPDFTNHRVVELVGEAFFQVRPDPEHPFVVNSGNSSTHVVGTAFNVSAYPEAGQLRISLQSGKIGVEYENKQGRMEKVLSPGELLIYDKESGVDEVMQQAPGEMDVWTAGRLLFFKTPMKEALAQIEARYGVHIIYDHVLKNETITARFDNTALEKVLAYLSFGWDLHFRREGKNLHVR